MEAVSTRLRVLIPLAFAAILGVAMITWGAAAPDTVAKGAKKAPAPKKIVPAFTLKDSDGKTVNLSDYKGKVVLVNFWATWCGPCKVEIPWFADFETRYKSRGFAVVGIAMDDEGWDAVKPYLAKAKINYRILLGNDNLAEAWGGVESLPSTFIIDQKGNIVRHHEGLVSKEDYEKDIKALLDKKADAGTGAGVVVARANHP
jgi:peroxiredoxin